MKNMILALAASVCVASAAHAQDTTKLPKDSGIVRTAGGEVVPPKKYARLIEVYDPETQEGIEGANVIDKITGNSAKTSPTGHIALIPEFVKESGALLTISKLGYEQVGPILVDPTSDTTLLVPMSKAATSLPAMTTVGRYNLATDAGKWEGFENRCAVKHVSCFAQNELATHPAARLSDMLLLAKDGGVKRKCYGSMANCVITVGGCAPAYFIDGMPLPVTRGTNPLSDLENRLSSPELIKGIEIYRPELTPLSFMTTLNSGCPAAVNIWTK